MVERLPASDERDREGGQSEGARQSGEVGDARPRRRCSGRLFADVGRIDLDAGQASTPLAYSLRSPLLRAVGLGAMSHQRWVVGPIARSPKARHDVGRPNKWHPRAVRARRHRYPTRKVMPNGIYPIFPLQIRQGSASQAHTVRAGLGLRLGTWWRRDRLDEQLANGDDPRTSAELTLRAEQLGTGAERVRLAEHLEGVLRHARAKTPQIHRLVRRRQVEACADELVALAHRLRDDQPIDLRGAAMTAQLLSDPRGPLHYKRASLPLREAVRSARLALDGSVRRPHPPFDPLPEPRLDRNRR